MSDRELLELAAKAVGVELDFSIRGDFPPYYVNERGGHSSWNPLTDDGDALRLAVKLYLWEPIRLAHRDITDAVDFYAATRRAIVRAAAEIGKGMQ